MAAKELDTYYAHEIRMPFFVITQADEPDSVKRLVEYLEFFDSDTAVGYFSLYYIRNRRIKFCMSDENTALHFKMRFA